jgi:hypothetical protein
MLQQKDLLMSILVLHVDARREPAVLLRKWIDWRTDLQAQDAVEMALGEAIMTQIQKDLLEENSQLTVSWTDRISGEHSGVGGVNDLQWHIGDNSVLTILYLNDSIESHSLERISEWMMESYSL